MKKVYSWLNYDYKNHPGEVNTKPSLTIPDETMTIKEILERYARGLPLDIGKVPLYDEDDDEPLPDFKNMDLAEIQEWKEQAQTFISNTQKKIKDENDMRLKTEQDKAFEEEVNKRIASRKKKSTEELPTADH